MQPRGPVRREPPILWGVPTSRPDSAPLHQLKNHLAVVVGFADLLVDSCALDDPRRADLLQIQSAAVASMALIPALERDADSR